MRLSAPSTIIFVISLVIAVLAALVALGTISFPSLASVWMMGIAYAVLAVGCLMRGA
ncbi:MAG: hypothetical protein H7X89_06460 [Rhizobiales bacterium]|nr:hypothetical protein [Hyphomicrobiales bacterium]